MVKLTANPGKEGGCPHKNCYPQHESTIPFWKSRFSVTVTPMIE